MSIPIPGDLGAAVNEAVNEELMRIASLEDIGAHEDQMGQLVIPNAKVTFYSSCGEWEVDIHTASGVCGFDVKYDDVRCGLKKDDEHSTAAWKSRWHVLSGLRYLLRDFSRDELVALVDEASHPDPNCDIDGWSLDDGGVR